MEPILLLVESWWWAAPAAVGAGAATYSGLTAKSRRARRLDIAATRLEERRAYRALLSARVDARSAKADVLSSRARPDASAQALAEARRTLAAAKLNERSAALHLRATRARLRAAVARYRSTPRGGPLPLEQLVARHDAVTAQWLTYETDAGKAMSFPQMLDAQHPSTLAFLRAQRDAQTLRAAALQERVAPETYLAYRDAVQAMESAFATAEADAQGKVREDIAGLSWGSLPTPVAMWLPRAADAIGEAARVVADVRDAVTKRQGGTAPRPGDRTRD